jgi:hypothetical protein
MEENVIKEKLEKELNNVHDNWIVFLETGVENSLEVNVESVKLFLKRGLQGIILSASRPYSNLLEIYKENGIETEKIIVLDGVSKGQKTDGNKNVIFLDGLDDLTNISIVLSDTYKQLPNKSFFFLDSVTSMLIYNNPMVFAKFIHSLLVKMRINNEGGILFSLEEETEKRVRAEIAQLCDKVIKI